MPRLLIACLAALATGCSSSPPSSFYALNALAEAGDEAAADYAVLLAPVSVPRLVDRPQITLQVGANRVEVDEFHRWAAPIGEDIARVVAADLATLLGTPRVATAAMQGLDPAYRVTIHVQRFETLRNAEQQNVAAVIEALWVVNRVKGDSNRSGRTIAREAAEGDSFDALVAAHSLALKTLSTEIAAAIRAEARSKP